MAYELIISEKPKQAAKIASALSDGKSVARRENGVSYFETTFQGKDIVVVSAVGHLYSLKELPGKKEFPSFNIEWVKASKVSKGADFTDKYIKVIEKLAKKASEITISCDYDIEGELIGYNAMRFAGKAKDANRMKFSTLTKPEIQEAYLKKAKTINWGMALAGETRHKLDWYYGINISRALTRALREQGVYKIMSSGRVQGPALKIIVDRELEIKKFVPVPFWKVKYTGTSGKEKIVCDHKEDKITDPERAKDIHKKCDGTDAIVSSFKTKEYSDFPPIPFDLTTLQTEIYKLFKITPSNTLKIAQNLYLAGVISYPRTSSQKLPPSLGLKKILTNLRKNPNYDHLVDQVLKKPKLSPRQGKKDDPAHPAIHPTGNLPEKIDKYDQRVYDVIVKRFISLFGESAIRISQKLEIDVKGEPFVVSGNYTKEKGWYKLYDPYVKNKEEKLTEQNKGDVIKFKKLELLEDFTKPPRRYSPASIVTELANRNLGTKATRANIIDILHKRNYIEGTQLTATELGLKTADTLSKFSPEILDEELTRQFEEDMELIESGKKKGEEILEGAKKILKKVIKNFGLKKKEIGEELKEANGVNDKIATCPVCKEGDLHIIRSKKTRKRFIACNRYPDCKTTFSIPQVGTVTKLEKNCELCGYPLIKVFNPKIKRTSEVCLNPACESNKSEFEGKPCPKCKKGKLVMKTSQYGKFLACDKYPDCKYTQRI